MFIFLIFLFYMIFNCQYSHSWTWCRAQCDEAVKRCGNDSSTLPETGCPSSMRITRRFKSGASLCLPSQVKRLFIIFFCVLLSVGIEGSLTGPDWGCSCPALHCYASPTLRVYGTLLCYSTITINIRYGICCLYGAGRNDLMRATSITRAIGRGGP